MTGGGGGGGWKEEAYLRVYVRFRGLRFGDLGFRA